MRNGLIAVRPLRERAVLAERYPTTPTSETSVVHVLCDADLESCVRELDGVGVGHRDWLLVDLSPVRSATPFTCSALVVAMDRLSPDRFCVVVPPSSRWLGAMLPRRARRVTFQSIGDALQMLVFAVDGLDGGWMGRGRAAVGPVSLNVSRPSLARPTFDSTALAEVAR